MPRPLLLIAILVAAFATTLSAAPNFIVIFTDDQGYNDLGCFGSENIKTPHIDRMAKEGMRFTDFYSAASVCTPSRAALLTGCYPERVGNLPVLFPRSNIGLNPDEITIADMLKEKGYATACIGKWHLGHHKEFLPTSQGFDYYYGIPYSNDMRIDRTMSLVQNVVWREGMTKADFKNGKSRGPPLMRGTEVIECPADQNTLSRRYTEEAIRFVQQNKDKPFFIYLPHTMPHIPLYATPQFEGKSEVGLYGDTIEEIDWCVGQLLNALRDAGVDRNTMVVYTSDNGPWKLAGNKTSKVKGNKNRRVGGSAFPLRGYKFQKFEGGMREPTVMWWPGRIPAGSTCSEIAGTIDLLPTFAELAETSPPQDRIIDGKSIVPLIEGKADAKTPHDAYFYRTLGVRSGKWKLLGRELFNLEEDIGESKNVAADNPEVVARLARMLTNHKADLAANRRPPGRRKYPTRKLESLPGWRIGQGNFKVEAGILKTTSTDEAAIFAPPQDLKDYTFEVTARATAGKEGFRIMARVSNVRNYYRLSVGAFANTQHTLLVVREGGVHKRVSPAAKGSVDFGKWYRMKLVVRGKQIQCFIDDELIQKAQFSNYRSGSIGLGGLQALAEFKGINVTAPDGKVLLKALPE
ncbi:MAG: sulfatase-like hydrolase/transferase [Planctomycetota bacterium]|nr:sulfatase-like hydrolase/transferase [Planctomycetota bacterium]